jgi:hypothetical protein
LLPSPLSTWYSQNAEQVIAASLAPDRRCDAMWGELDSLKAQLERSPDGAAAIRKQIDSLRRQARVEAARHYVNLDAMTELEPPFADFPRDRAAAERHVAEYLARANRAKAAELLGVDLNELPQTLSENQLTRLGTEALARMGNLPWAIDKAAADLTDAFRRGDMKALPTHVGELAHLVADLHMPLHLTANYDGQATKQRGVHRALEIDMINRHADHYGQLPPMAARRYDAWSYPLDVREEVFAIVGRNPERIRTVLAADAEARRRSRVQAGDFEWLKSLDREQGDAIMTSKDVSRLDARARRLVAHVGALHRSLREKHDDAARQWMGESASMLAALVYNAWLQAGRPTLEPQAVASATEPEPEVNWIIVVPAAVMLGIMTSILLNRRKGPPGHR